MNTYSAWKTWEFGCKYLKYGIMDAKIHLYFELAALK